MALLVHCTHCERRYNLDPKLAGRKVKCKGCGGVFQVVPEQGAATTSTSATPPSAVSHPSNRVHSHAASHARRAVAPATPPPRPTAGRRMVANDDPFAAMSLLEAGTPLPPEDRPVYSGASMLAPPVVIPAGGPEVLPYTHVAPRRPQPRPNASVGTDSLTPILLLCLLVGMAGITIYRLVEISNLSENGVHPLAIQAAKRLTWTVAISFTIAHFVVIAPLCMLAVFIGSKIMNFELPGSPYLRAAGVASLPLVASMGIQLLAPDDLTIRLCLIIAILPLGFYVLKNIFELTLTESLVSYAFTVIFFVIGLVIAILMSGAVAATGIVQSEADVRKAILEQRQQAMQEQMEQRRGERPRPGFSPPGFSPSNDVPPPMTVTPMDPMEARAFSLQRRLQSFNSRNFTNQSREFAQRELSSVEKDVAAAPAELQSRPEWPGIVSELESARRTIAGLSSEMPDPDLFKPMPADAEFPPPANGVAALDAEISFDKFALRPPADAKLDLRESTAKQLQWEMDGSSGEFSLSIVPRKNAKQQRPWLVTRPFHVTSAEREDLFYIEAREAGRTTFGTLAGLPAAKLTGESPQREQFVQYILLDGNRWIVLQIRSRSNSSAAMDLFDMAARTLRPMRADEPKADPFAPERIASRLGEDPQEVSALLRKQPAAAEPIVIDLLNSDDSRTRQAAAELLPYILSEKSLPKIEPLANHPDRNVSEAVRGLLRKMDPSFDALAELILDLRSDDSFKRRQAMDKLASTTPDPKRQNEVAQMLEDVVAPEDATSSEARSAAAALANWPGEKTATRLAPLLNNPNLSSSRRDVLLTAISGAREAVAVNVVMKWLPKATDQVTQILTQMGPVAEEETIRILTLYFTNNTGDGPKVRSACINILSEIGTARSLDVLGRASRDRRDLVAQAAAKQAIERVKERAAASPATKPSSVR